MSQAGRRDLVRSAEAAPACIRSSISPRAVGASRVGVVTHHHPPVVFYHSDMPDAAMLTPADPSDLADAIAYALRFQGRKRVHNADEIMAEIVARRLVEHLERTGYVIMKKPAEIGAAALGRGFCK